VLGGKKERRRGEERGGGDSTWPECGYYALVDNGEWLLCVGR
jgi:hypothetical protein